MRYVRALHNRGNARYLLDVVVGGEPLQATVDTVSYDFWVFVRNWSDGRSGAGDFYDPDRSLAFTPLNVTASQRLGNRTVRGELATDGFDVGPIYIERQLLWKAVAQDPRVSAVFGLGPPEVPVLEARDSYRVLQAKALRSIRNSAAPKRSNAEVAAALNSSKTAQLVSKYRPFLASAGVTSFSLCLERASGALGYLILNDALGPAARLFAPVPVVGTTSWTVEMGSVRFSATGSDGSRVAALPLGCEDGCGALLDSSTALIAAPDSIVSLALSKLQELDFDCRQVGEMPNLEFQLGGQLHSLPPSSYVGEVTGEPPAWLRALMPHLPKYLKGCQLLLMGLGDRRTQFGPLWVLGMPFFREYYTNFHRSSGYNTSDGDGGKNWKIRTAVAGGGCEPSEGAAASPAHRQVDLSQATISRSIWNHMSSQIGALFPI